MDSYICEHDETIKIYEMFKFLNGNYAVTAKMLSALRYLVAVATKIDKA